MITADSVERILAKMREMPQFDQRVLLQIDRDVLLRELQLCAANFSGRSHGAFRLTGKNLEKLSRLEKLLRDLRNDPKTPWGFLGKETTNALKSDKIIDELAAVLACRPTPRLKANPTELLVGQDLPFIFKGFTGRRAVRSRYPGGPLRDGAYLRFAQAVLAEMNINYSDESISRALTDRGRRRLGRNANKKRRQRRAARGSFSKTA
jgi:hypothetical protein